MGSNLVNNNFENKSELINNSIRCLLDCIRNFEHMRSDDSFDNIQEQDVVRILGGLKNLEKNIEIINKKVINKTNKNVYKAIGKNKTLWVVKPEKNFDSGVDNIFKSDLKIKTFKKTYNIKDLYNDIT